MTRTLAQKMLFEGKHEESVPAAMQSLRYAIDVYGVATIELVPSYLILGEASIGESRSLNYFQSKFWFYILLFFICFFRIIFDLLL